MTHTPYSQATIKWRIRTRRAVRAFCRTEGNPVAVAKMLGVPLPELLLVLARHGRPTNQLLLKLSERMMAVRYTPGVFQYRAAVQAGAAWLIVPPSVSWHAHGGAA